MLTVTRPSKEYRWIVLGIDGRYVTLGRDSDPTKEDIRIAEDALLAVRGGAKVGHWSGGVKLLRAA